MDFFVPTHATYCRIAYQAKDITATGIELASFYPPYLKFFRY